MKKIGLFISLVLILAACAPSDNLVAIAQAQSAIESARAAQQAALAAQTASQGLRDVGLIQALILLLLTLMLLVLLGLAVYVIAKRSALFQTNARPVHSGQWLSGPNAHWKKAGEPDLNQQMLLEQQLLLAQLLSQGQEEADRQDLSGLPADWWG